MSTARLAGLFLLLLLAPGLSQARYADLTFTVDETGTVTTEGITDVPSLPLGISDNFTTKNHAYWIVNISTPEQLDSFVYSLRLPTGATVNYLSGRNARITTDGDHVVIRGTGQDSPLTVVVQYTLSTPKKSNTWWPYLVGICAVALLAIGSHMLWKRKPKVQPQQKEKSNVQTRTPTIVEGLAERQQEIVALLRKSGGTLTQRQVELALKLPKSSVSRNVEALRRRGILQKAQTGMSNTLVLETQYR